MPATQEGVASKKLAAVLPNAGKRLCALAPLLAIVTVAAALRFADLGSKSLWSDEAFSIVMAKMPWRELWQRMSTAEANMALYYALLHVWVRAGDSARWVTLLSAVSGVATVPVVYWLGKAVFSRRAGLLAAFLLAINVFHIQYSQQARSYSLFVLLVAISYLSFFRLLSKSTRPWQTCYILSTALALYAHFFAALVLLTQLVSLAATPQFGQKTKRQIAVMGTVLILALPAFCFVLFNNHGQLNWIRPVYARDLYHFFLTLIGSGIKFGIALTAFFVAILMWRAQWRARGWNMQAWLFLAIMLWLFLPVCVTFLISIWKPVYAPRFLIFCLPSAVLLIGEGLAEIAYAPLRYILVALLIVGAVHPLRAYYAAPGQEDWKSAVRYLARNAASGDTIYLPDAYCDLPFRYELSHTQTVLPSLRMFQPEMPESLQQTGSRQVWMIGCSAGRDFHPEPRLGNYSERESRQFSGVRVIRFERLPEA